MTRQFHQTRNDGEIVVDVSAPEGTFRPHARDLIMETWSEHTPKNVSVKTGDAPASALPRLEAEAFEKSSRGWTFSNGLLRAKTEDTFKATQFAIER